MKAILLAAGIGSRIKGIDVPKCILEVNGKPIICQTIEMLQSKGVEIAVVVGYRKKQIIEKIENYSNVTVFYNPFFRVTNSIASLWFAKEFAFEKNEDIIIANADVLWDEYIFDQLVYSCEERTMVSDSSRVKKGEGDFFFTLNSDYVTGYGKELQLEERDTEYVGVTKIASSSIEKFKFKMIELIEAEKYDMWWENILYEDIERCPIFSLDINGHLWGEVDTIEDYYKLCKIIK